jgi:hypothetical protein
MAKQTLNAQLYMSIVWKVNWLWRRLLRRIDPKRGKTEEG